MCLVGFVKAFHLVLATALISGFSIYINKFLLVGQEPITMTFVKMALATIVLLLVPGTAGKFKRLKRSDWTRLSIIGLIGGSIPFVLFFYALTFTSAASASFIHKMMFVLASILSYKVLKEKFNRSKIISVSVAFFGVFFLFGMSGISLSVFDLLIFVATLFWAVEQVLSKKLLEDVDPHTLASARLGFGSLFIFIFLLIRGFGTVSLLPIAISSIFLVAYVSTWYRGLDRLDVSTATTVLLLGSVVTTFLQMNISLQGLFGSVLIAAAILPTWRKVTA
jgi:drug/metabolite transporter (DMT)-like permease